MLMVLLDTGIRCSELVGLDVDDLDLFERRIRILHAKGCRQRVVSFAGRCAQALDAYLEARGPDSGALFWAAHERWLHPGEILQPNGLKQMLRRLVKRTGIPNVHAHRFRHTFATRPSRQNARELDVQYLLRHASPDMVRGYSATYNSEQAARRHAAFSPAERLPAGA